MAHSVSPVNRCPDWVFRVVLVDIVARVERLLVLAHLFQGGAQVEVVASVGVHIDRLLKLLRGPGEVFLFVQRLAGIVVDFGLAVFCGLGKRQTRPSIGFGNRGQQRQQNHDVETSQGYRHHHHLVFSAFKRTRQDR